MGSSAATLASRARPSGACSVMFTVSRSRSCSRERDRAAEASPKGVTQGEGASDGAQIEGSRVTRRSGSVILPSMTTGGGFRQGAGEVARRDRSRGRAFELPTRMGISGECVPGPFGRISKSGLGAPYATHRRCCWPHRGARPPRSPGASPPWPLLLELRRVAAPLGALLALGSHPILDSPADGAHPAENVQSFRPASGGPMVGKQAQLPPNEMTGKQDRGSSLVANDEQERSVYTYDPHIGQCP